MVIEEYLEGPEVSVLAFTDGKTIKPMVSSMDTSVRSTAIGITRGHGYDRSEPVLYGGDRRPVHGGSSFRRSRR